MFKKIGLIAIICLIAMPAFAAAPQVARNRATGSVISLSPGSNIRFEFLDETIGETHLAEQNAVDDNRVLVNSVYIWNDTTGSIYVNLTGTDVTGNDVTANIVSADCIEIASTDTVYGPVVFDPFFTRAMSVTTTNTGPTDEEIRIWATFEY